MTAQLTTSQNVRTVPVEVLTTSGRAARVEFHVTPANVEVWRAQGRAPAACVAQVDTWQVRQWLASPTGTLRAGDLSIELDGSLDRERPRLAVSLPDVNVWSLSPAEHTEFVAAVQRAHA